MILESVRTYFIFMTNWLSFMAPHSLCGDQHIVNTGISANVLHLLHPGIWHPSLVTGECVHLPQPPV